MPSGAPSTGTLFKGAGGAAIAGLNGGTSLSQTIPDYATGAEVCLAFINAFSGEGADRTELRDTEQDAIVATVTSNCNTIVIINTVGARILDSWIENENVTAVIYGGLLGQESGNSLVDVLYSDSILVADLRTRLRRMRVIIMLRFVRLRCVLHGGGFYWL